jgi:hypothetical protein
LCDLYHVYGVNATPARFVTMLVQRNKVLTSS